MPDMVNHPPHYTFGNTEVIDFIEGVGAPYHLGNVIKYVARAGKKGHPREDYEKARWYLHRYINLGWSAPRPIRSLSAALVQHIVTKDWGFTGDVAAVLLCVALDGDSRMRLRHALERLDALIDYARMLERPADAV